MLPFQDTHEIDSEHASPDEVRAHFIGAGRKPYPTVQNLVQATTDQQIYRDYPFTGTLLVFNEESGEYQFVKHFDRPTKLSEISKRREVSTGDYMITRRSDSGEDIEIPFSIQAGSRKDASKQAPQAPSHIDIESLRSKIKEEIHSDYNRAIQLYKSEADTYSRRVADLQTQLADIHHKFSQEKVELVTSHHNELGVLRQEISELKLQLAIAKVKAELGDGFVDEIDDETDENPAWLKALNAIAPMIRDAMSSPALASSPASHIAEVTDVTTTAAQLSEVAEPSAAQPNPDPMQNALQQFYNTIIQGAMDAMTAQNAPSTKKLAKFVSDQLSILAQSGVAPSARDWTMIATHLATEAVRLNVTPERVAQVISPMLDNLEAAKTTLRYVPADTAADLLFKAIGFEPAAPIRQLIISVLTVFKQKLSA